VTVSAVHSGSILRIMMRSMTILFAGLLCQMIGPPVAVGAQTVVVQDDEMPSPPMLGQYRLTRGGFARPMAVAISPSGLVAIADAMDRVVRVLRRDGTDLLRIRGQRDAKLVDPAGVAWLDDRTLAITDRTRGRVLLATIAGDQVDRTITREIGTTMYRPSGIDAFGSTLAVADTGNHRIVLATNDSVTTIGGRGDDEGQLRRPADVAFDDNGRLYVADTGNQRIQRFISSDEGAGWTADLAFGGWGAFPGLFAEPTAIDVEGDRLYVADAINHRVQVFDLDGNFLDLWGMHALVPREGEGRIHYPNGIAVGHDVRRAVVAEAFERRVQFFGPFANPAEREPPQQLQKGQQSHFGTLLTRSGERLAVWEPETRTILIFAARYEVPIFITQFGGDGHRLGRFGRIPAMMLDDKGATLHVIDPDYDRVQTFAIGGVGEEMLRYDPLMAKFAFSRRLSSLSPDGEPLDITALCTRPDGDGYALLDARGQRIILVDDEWSVESTLEAGDAMPSGVDLCPATGDDGWLVVDDIRRTVLHLDREGRTREAAVPDMIRPLAIAVAEDGVLAIVDAQDDVIYIGVPGRSFTTIGVTGEYVGELFHPGEAAFLPGGELVVVDYGNHRAQIFQRDGTWRVSFGVGRAYTYRNPPQRPDPEAGEKTNE